jgi:hypothetical protein
MTHVVPNGWIRGEKLVWLVRPVFKNSRMSIGTKRNRSPFPPHDGPLPDQCYSLEFNTYDELNGFIKWWYNPEKSDG